MSTDWRLVRTIHFASSNDRLRYLCNMLDAVAVPKISELWTRFEMKLACSPFIYCVSSYFFYS